MRPAANHPDVLRRLVVALIAIRVEIAGKVLQKLFHMLRLLAGPILVEYNGRPIILAYAVQPHIALALNLFLRFPQYLKGSLIRVEHLSLHQMSVQLIVRTCSVEYSTQLDMVCRGSFSPCRAHFCSCQHSGLTITYFCIIMWEMASGGRSCRGSHSFAHSIEKLISGRKVIVKPHEDTRRILANNGAG